jgi:hypothetical protein
MLTTELHTRTIPDLFARFAEVIGEKHWLNRAKACGEEIRGNRFLKDYLVTENNIAFGLAHLSKLAKNHGGKLPIEASDDKSIYPAASFAAQVLSFIDALPKTAGERFRRRVHGAFRNPDDMRGLRLEMAVATHFIRRGKRVRWPETTGEGRFDLLVEDAGPDGLEVECKSISDDKGRRIHRREMLDFVHLLRPHLRSTIAGLSAGMFAVVTLPGRLPTTFKLRRELAKEVGAAIFEGRNTTLREGASIRIGDFDVAMLHEEQLGEHGAFRMLVDKITGTSNREVVVIGTPGGGALALAVQSAQDDKLLEATFDTLGHAARSQLSGQRAGIVLARFSGLHANELVSVAQQDDDPSSAPTPLRLKVSRFLSSADRDHLVGVGVLSSDSLRQVEAGVVGFGGVAYYFPNEDSRYWSNDFKGMFSWATESKSNDAGT